MNEKGEIGIPVSDRSKVVRTFSNVIPRKRRPSGEPIPRRVVGMRPLVTLDPVALECVAVAYAENPEAARLRIPWLKARNALAASENAVRVRWELEERMAVESAKAQTKMNALEPTLKEIDEQLNHATSDLAALAAPLGLRCIGERSSMEFDEGEPMSLEELAGKYHLPSPEQNPNGMYRSGYRLLAGMGGGAVCGINLGLLTGKLELLSLAEEWPWLVFWAALGMMVMTLVGASLYPLAKSLGEQLTHIGRRLPWIAGAKLALTAVFLTGLALIFVITESKVEQLGLFKALSEQSSFKGTRISQSDLIWVSLMLVIPTVASYVVLGVREGERVASLAHLKALRSDLRQEIRIQSSFADACKLHQQVQSLRFQKSAIEARMLELKGHIRTEFTSHEKERMEDMDMDAATASWEAEDSLTSLASHLEPVTPVRARKGFLIWLLPRVQALARWFRLPGQDTREVGS